MDYRKVYLQIIRKAKQEQLCGNRPRSYSFRKRKICTAYYEFHHILPKSLFPQFSKINKNIVPLTAREHFICHKLLCHIYPSRSMAYALLRLCHTKTGKLVVSASEYNRIKMINGYYSAITLAGHPISQSTRDKISKTLKHNYATGIMKGHIPEFTQEDKNRISTTLKSRYADGMVVWNKGKTCPCLAKFKHKNPMYGKHHYTNGIDNVVGETCPNGYRPGSTRKVNELVEMERRMKIIQSNTGRHWFNDGKINKFCNECPAGFVKGMLNSRWLNNDIKVKTEKR